MRVGILHPGAMGVSVAAAAQQAGCELFWVATGRSPESQQRAAEQQLQDVQTIAALCETCELIISVCPPHAAVDVAQQMAQHQYTGLYLDANAISPTKTKAIGEIITGAGGRFVDGGIVGGPAWQAGTTWLYLSGTKADTNKVAACFTGSPLGTEILAGGIGQASALKMCFAAYTKGTTALLAAILATAEAEGVQDALAMQWDRYWDDFASQTNQRVQAVTAKAWRFAGEMEEIADTLDAAGLPDGFHTAAGELYQRLAHFKGAAELPSLAAIFQALQKTL